MKKSEYEAKRRGKLSDCAPWTWTAQIARDVEAAEDAGVVWDPEEEPLPERLIAVPAPAGAFVMVPLPQRHIGPEERFPSMIEAAEAVRRYNAWPELEKLASKLPESPIHGDPCRFHCQLYHVQRILRGGAQ